MSLPLTLRITGRRVVVVGGGNVATRRALRLIKAGAQVVVISPAASDALRDAAEAGQLSWEPRTYQSGDLAGAWLVQTATALSEIDQQVADDAEAQGTWCLKGGDPAGASAWMPAVTSVDDITIAVSGGGDAGRATAIRDAIATQLETGELPLRPRTHRPAGSVALIGGGPGDERLLTVRARRLLSTADVVVADRLGPRSVLENLPADIEIIDVGKRPDHHPVPQDQINQILIDRANAGQKVVRLKGGDPYVFGRGGEERLACEAAGIAVEVVPGITSAIAAAAAAGIPVTHRGVADGFSVVTGHDRLSALPTTSRHTIVILMGVKRLAQSVNELLEAGHALTTPVAIVESGTLPDQRVTVGTLATIVAHSTEVVSPAIIVVGDVATLAHAWPGPPASGVSAT